MNKKLLISAILLFFMISLGIIALGKKNNEPDNIPEEYKFTITGRLLWANKSPVHEGASVWLYEVIEEEGKIKTMMKVGEGGKVLNPISETDKTGKFTIVADRRFWEESGQFTLSVTIMGKEYYLRKSKDIPLVIVVEEEAREIDLGDIVVH